MIDAPSENKYGFNMQVSAQAMGGIGQAVQRPSADRSG
jgi:hypothetical protein